LWGRCRRRILRKTLPFVKIRESEQKSLTGWRDLVHRIS
jgi:hypothetical protein